MKVDILFRKNFLFNSLQGFSIFTISKFKIYFEFVPVIKLNNLMKKPLEILKFILCLLN